VEAIPEDIEGVGGCVGHDPIAKEMEFVCPRDRSVEIHPGGRPIIHSTKAGERSPPPVPVVSGLGEDAFGVDTGVGNIPRCAIV
jgi:hypothetical protein